MRPSSRRFESPLRSLAAIALSFAFVALAAATPQDGAAVPPASSGASAAGADAGRAEAADSAPDEGLAAVVLEVAGKVRTRDAADAPWRALAENDVLRAGAEVQTGLRSHAAIRMGRNATVLLDAGSLLIIPDLRQEAGVLVTRAAVRAGRADIKVDRVGIESDFSVITPSTTIAVKGTTLAVQSGRLVGTEVTGARTNEMSAIEARWIARRLIYYFGQGASSSRLPDPAQNAIDRSVARNIMPGVVDDRSQLEQAWANGSLQNVVFNLNNLQRVLNLDASIFDDQLAEVAALAQLLEIRAVTGELAEQGQGAAMLAAAFSQKAQQLAAEAAQMLPDLEEIVSKQTQPAQDAAKEAYLARQEADDQKDIALDKRDDAVGHLAHVITAIEQEDYEKAQEQADLAGMAAAAAGMAAKYAGIAAKDAMYAASDAAAAAATAQQAINQYFAKVAEIDQCAADSAAFAAIARSAADASMALQSLADQLATAVSDNAASGIVADINSNVAAAIAAANAATVSRDEALAAASNARSMGERVLFNMAAVYAAQAAADAAAAAKSAAIADSAAIEAWAAADLAYDLAYGKGKGKGSQD